MTNGKPRRISNPLGLAILAQLFEKSMHPYELAATMRERGKHESIKLNYGSLYTVIGSLERAGFIQAEEKTRQGTRPERTVYSLTPEGKAELFDWMRDLVGTPVKEYPQFEAALALLPILPPDEVKALLETRLKLLDERLASVRKALEDALSHGLARLFLIETEYHIAMVEAERNWVAELLRLMKTSRPFTKGWRAFHEQRGTKR